MDVEKKIKNSESDSKVDKITVNNFPWSTICPVLFTFACYTTIFLNFVQPSYANEFSLNITSNESIITCETDLSNTIISWTLQSSETFLGSSNQTTSQSVYNNFQVNFKIIDGTSKWSSSLIIFDNITTKGVFKCNTITADGQKIDKFMTYNYRIDDPIIDISTRDYLRPDKTACCSTETMKLSSNCSSNICNYPYPIKDSCMPADLEVFPVKTFSMCLLSQNYFATDCCAKRMNIMNNSCLNLCQTSSNFITDMLNVTDCGEKILTNVALCTSIGQTDFSMFIITIRNLKLAPPLIQRIRVLILPPGDKAIVYWTQTDAKGFLLKIFSDSVMGELKFLSQTEMFYLYSVNLSFITTSTKQIDFSISASNDLGFGKWSPTESKDLGPNLLPEITLSSPKDVTDCCNTARIHFECIDLLCNRVPAQLNYKMVKNNCLIELPRALNCHAKRTGSDKFKFCCSNAAKQTSCLKYCETENVRDFKAPADFDCLMDFLPKFDKCLRKDFPTQPDYFKVVYRTDNSVKLGWSKSYVPNFPLMNVEYVITTKNNNFNKVIINNTQLEYEIFNLKPSSDYIFQIFARNKFGQSSIVQTNAQTLKEKEFLPPRIIKLSQVAFGEATIHILLDPIVQREFTNYDIQVFKDWTGVDIFAKSDQLKRNIVLIRLLNFNSNFSVRLRAVGKNSKASPWSELTKFTTPKDMLSIYNQLTQFSTPIDCCNAFGVQTHCLSACKDPFHSLPSNAACAESNDFGYVTFCLSRGMNNQHCCQLNGVSDSCLDACQGSWHSISAQGPDIQEESRSDSPKCISELPIMNLCFQKRFNAGGEHKAIIGVLLILILILLIIGTAIFLLAIYWSERGFPSYMHRCTQLKQTLQRMSAWALKKEINRPAFNRNPAPIMEFNNPITFHKNTTLRPDAFRVEFN